MAPHSVRELPTPALIIDVDVFESNLAAMALRWPGAALRPHVKAHKSTALAARQVAHGHRTFTCATPREVVGMAAMGIGDDLLLANETLDPRRLTAMAAAQRDVAVTIAVDSAETIDAAARAGIEHVLIDVNVGLPRCGCPPDQAGRLADRARAAGMEVRGVMGYEGHLMMVLDATARAAKVAAGVDLLLTAHGDVGGHIVSAGGTGTWDVHDRITELQAGSYALMDSAYTQHDSPFRQALFIVGTIISVSDRWKVADVGLKAQGMDHGNPSIAGHEVWFCSDEHVTFTRSDASDAAGSEAAGSEAAGSDAPRDEAMRVGDRVRVTPAHVDPTMAMHDEAWLVRGDEILDRWAIDLRGW